jgi:hypothetical protein
VVYTSPTQTSQATTSKKLQHDLSCLSYFGTNSYARKSDTSRFCNAVDLYQPGFNAFSGDWTTCVRLSRVFDSWRRDVESGEWRVSLDGVMDDIAKFRDADTEEKWERYYLAPDW